MMMMMMMMIIKMGQSYQVIIVVQLFERWDDGSTDNKQRMIIIKINYVAGFFQFILEIKNCFIQVFIVGLAFVLWLKLNHCEIKIYKNFPLNWIKMVAIIITCIFLVVV